MNNHPYISVKSVSKITYSILLMALLLLLSCAKQSEISKDFNCLTTAYKNLEKVDDVKNLFSLQLPKNWKINLYQDEVQSSILQQAPQNN
jgi:hypothetical protein